MEDPMLALVDADAPRYRPGDLERLLGSPSWKYGEWQRLGLATGYGTVTPSGYQYTLLDAVGFAGADILAKEGCQRGAALETGKGLASCLLYNLVRAADEQTPLIEAVAFTEDADGNLSAAVWSAETSGRSKRLDDGPRLVFRVGAWTGLVPAALRDEVRCRVEAGDDHAA